MRDQPATGEKLLRKLGLVAASRQLENARRERSVFVPQNLVLSSAMVSPASDEPSRTELHEALRARLTGRV